jgi:Ion transport protein
MLRPLRSLGNIPGMKLVVTALIDSLPAIFNVVLILALFVFLFAIFGFQTFGNLLYNRCRQPITNFTNVQYWPLYGTGEKLCGYRECKEGY